MAEVGLRTWCDVTKKRNTLTSRPYFYNGNRHATVILKNEITFGMLSTCKESEGGATSDLFRYLFQTFPLREPVFFLFRLLSKKVEDLLFPTASWAAPGQSSPFLRGTTWRVPLRTSWVGHLGDLIECVNEWSAATSAAHNGALLYWSRSSKDFGVGSLEKKKKMPECPEPLWILMKLIDSCCKQRLGRAQQTVATQSAESGIYFN